MDQKQAAVPMQGTAYRVTDRFYSRLRQLVREKVIPYQWEALNDRVPGAEKSGCIANFENAAALAAGKAAGPHYGFVFQDSDLFKWMEAASFSLMWAPDPVLEQELESMVSLIAQAQLPDGYVNTYYILHDIRRRWTNLKDNHELYCAGHMIEAAAAHFRATGSRRFLEAAEKLADHIDSVFGPEEEKKHGYPGHEEIELALVKLYEATGKERYLKLAWYFLDQRGREPLYFREETEREGNGFYWAGGVYGYNYYQADRPLLEQEAPIGHAVRANYLYTGAAAAARCRGDELLYRHLCRLWQEITEKQMYITGQVGASNYGEAYTFPYDLPNDLAYAETCAGLALAFFANQMLRIQRRGCYADVLERVMYNGAVSGMDLTGTAFFYVNPLEVYPEACRKNQQKAHVEPVRKKWFGCACCPPNLARTVASITEYAVHYTEQALFQHLYLAGNLSWETQGVPVEICLEGDYPWEGALRWTVRPERQVRFTYGLRIPGWAGGQFTLKVNGERLEPEIRDGYVYVERTWSAGDVMELLLPMEVRRVWAHREVRADAGRVAVQRGPVVYCLEEADNGGGLHRVLLPRDSAFTVRRQPELLGDVVTLHCRGLFEEGESEALYSFTPPKAPVEKELTWIPYYAWANRGEGEMITWVRDGGD